MPSSGITAVAENESPAPAPVLHRGYVRATMQDLAGADGGWLKIAAIGKGSTHCVVGRITGITPDPDPDTAISFHCEDAGGELLRGRVSTTGCTSFRPY